MIVLRSAAPYSSNSFNVDKLFTSPANEVSTFAIGLEKNTQRAIRYNMYSLVMNYLSEKVFTPRDIDFSDDVKVHLGLTGGKAGEYYMDL